MASFLKCDVDGCDHFETVPCIDRSLIGKPCPKCGANLLTDEDCEEWLATIDPVMGLLKALGAVDADDALSGGVPLKVGLHKSKMTVETGGVTIQTFPTPEPK